MEWCNIWTEWDVLRTLGYLLSFSHIFSSIDFDVISATRASIHDACDTSNAIHQFSSSGRRQPYTKQPNYGNGKDYHFREKHWNHLNSGRCDEIEKRVFIFHFETFPCSTAPQHQLDLGLYKQQNEFTMCISHEISNAPVFINLSARSWFMLLFSEIRKFCFVFLRIRAARTAHTKPINFVTQKIMSSGLTKLGKTNKRARSYAHTQLTNSIQFRIKVKTVMSQFPQFIWATRKQMEIGCFIGSLRQAKSSRLESGGRRLAYLWNNYCAANFVCWTKVTVITSFCGIENKIGN